MDSGLIRTAISELSFEIFGVDATLYLPGAPESEAVSARGLWIRPATELAPTGAGFTRASDRRVLAFRRVEVAEIPRATRIEAPGPMGGAVARWVADGIDSLDPDFVGVIVLSNEE